MSESNANSDQIAGRKLPGPPEGYYVHESELASLRQQLATRERQLKLAVKGMKQGREVVVVVAMAGKHLVDLFERDADETSMILDDVELWPLDSNGKPMPIEKGGK